MQITPGGRGKGGARGRRGQPGSAGGSPVPGDNEPPPLRWPEGAARPGQLSGATHDLSRALWPFAGARVAHAWPREGSPPERWGGFARGDRAGDREAGAPGPERSLCAAVYTALTLNRELGTKRRWLVWFSPPSLPPSLRPKNPSSCPGRGRPPSAAPRRESGDGGRQERPYSPASGSQVLAIQLLNAVCTSFYKK